MGRIINLKEQLPSSDDDNITKRRKRMAEEEDNKEEEKKRKKTEEEKRTEELSKELGIQAVSGIKKELKVEKVKPEDEFRLLPKKEVLPVIAKEIGIGVKEQVKEVGTKVKKGVFKAPQKVGKAVKKGASVLGEKLKQKMKEEQEFAKKVKTIRREAQLSAIRQEAMEGVSKARKEKLGVRKGARLKVPLLSREPKVELGLPKANGLNFGLPKRKGTGLRLGRTSLGLPKAKGSSFKVKGLSLELPKRRKKK